MSSRSKEEDFFNSRVIRDLDEFKKISDVKDVEEKVYTRDLFSRD